MREQAHIILGLFLIFSLKYPFDKQRTHIIMSER